MLPARFTPWIALTTLPVSRKLPPMDSLEGSASELEHDPTSHWVQGIATLYDAGHYEQAAERAGAALESFPGHPSLHYIRGLGVD